MQTEFKLKVYTSLSKLVAAVLGKERAKAFFEWQYWRFQSWKESGSLSNAHYKWVYTEAFGLKEEFYKDKVLLDVGCGPRGSLEWASQAKRRVGLDPLADKYSKLIGKGSTMEYVSSPAERMPFDSNSFDIVTCFNALDHVENLDSVLGEISRVLKKGGTFLLLTDIHEEAAVCEPTTVPWELSEVLSPTFKCLFEKRLKRKDRIYESIQFPEDYIVSLRADYGLLVAHYVKT